MKMHIGRYQILFWGFSLRNWCFQWGEEWPGRDRDPKLTCSFRTWQVGPIEIRRWLLTDEEAAEEEQL